jgi:hypothetical protein
MHSRNAVQKRGDFPRSSSPTALLAFEDLNPVSMLSPTVVTRATWKVSPHPGSWVAVTIRGAKGTASERGIAYNLILLVKARMPVMMVSVIGEEIILCTPAFVMLRTINILPGPPSPLSGGSKGVTYLSILSNKLPPIDHHLTMDLQSIRLVYSSLAHNNSRTSVLRASAASELSSYYL